MKEIQRVVNPKVGVYYENNKPYLLYQAEYHFNDETIFDINIPKIDLSKIDVNLEIKREYYPHYKGIPQSFINSVISKISFDIIPDQNHHYYTLIDKTPIKEMTKEEIEKELGYKIKIKD